MIDDSLSAPLNIEELLNSKRPQPLAPEHEGTLRKLESIDVLSFNEAEVRCYIIDPIVRILGYDKGQTFSANLEHPLKFRGKTLYVDYNLMLWEKNFWLIEAKRPRPGAVEFSYEDIKQAIEYSIHPHVNAALVALCDGIKLEVFDREISVEIPVLQILIKELSTHFDRVRTVLEPLQIWFFQKRRIVRLVDKVFDNEFNMARVEEFSELIDRRLKSKRMRVVENFRSNIKPDHADQLENISTATVEDLSEIYLFSVSSVPIINRVSDRLSELSLPISFKVLSRIFPDLPRDINDNYMPQAVAYLMRLGQLKSKVEWLPEWLSPGAQAQVELGLPTKFLLKQCLTYFEDYEPYRLILLAACAAQRIAKVMVFGSEPLRRAGSQLHALARHILPEISWGQIVASPEGQLTAMIDRQARLATLDFVKQNSGKQGKFLIESAKMQLRHWWDSEKALLGLIGNYPALAAEKPLGDMRLTECASVTYDCLGHLTLCLIKRFPAWEEYALSDLKDSVELLARIGSWSAKELIGIPPREPYGAVTDSEMAGRFFLGDEAVLRSIRAGYQRQ